MSEGELKFKLSLDTTEFREALIAAQGQLKAFQSFAQGTWNQTVRQATQESTRMANEWAAGINKVTESLRQMKSEAGKGGGDRSPAKPPPIPKPKFDFLGAKGNTQFQAMRNFFAGGGNNVLSKAFGGLTALNIAFWELRPVIDSVKFAVEKFEESLSKGFDLFTKSSQLGVSSGELFQKRFASQVTGLPEHEIDRLMLRFQSGTGRRSVQQYGDLAQLASLPKPFQDAILFTNKMRPEWERLAPILYTSQVRVMQMKESLSLFQAEIVANVAPAIGGLADKLSQLPWDTIGQAVGKLLEPFKDLVVMFEAASAVFEKFANSKFFEPIKAFMAIVDEGYKQIAAANQGILKSLGIEDKPYEHPKDKTPLARMLPSSQWERLGLSIGSGGMANTSKQIVDNTKQISDRVLQLIQVTANALGSSAANGLGGYAANLP